MTMMDQNDSADVKQIFDGINEEDLNEDMVLFKEAQRQALLAKDSTGNICGTQTKVSFHTDRLYQHREA